MNALSRLTTATDAECALKSPSQCVGTQVVNRDRYRILYGRHRKDSNATLLWHPQTCTDPHAPTHFCR